MSLTSFTVLYRFLCCAQFGCIFYTFCAQFHAMTVLFLLMTETEFDSWHQVLALLFAVFEAHWDPETFDKLVSSIHSPFQLAG